MDVIRITRDKDTESAAYGRRKIDMVVTETSGKRGDGYGWWAGDGNGWGACGWRRVGRVRMEIGGANGDGDGWDMWGWRRVWRMEKKKGTVRGNGEGGVTL